MNFLGKRSRRPNTICRAQRAAVGSLCKLQIIHYDYTPWVVVVLLATFGELGASLMRLSLGPLHGRGCHFTTKNLSPTNS